jgi:ParB family chromosome partitioning protein
VTDTISDPGIPAEDITVMPAGLPWLVSVDQLTAHPGNVREDLDLTDEFCASVAEAGVRVPLLVTPLEDGGFQVIEGHRRLAAAIRAGHREVPCVPDSSRAADAAGQFLDMAVANSDAYRRNFTPAEEAAALFAAHEAGASRTRIRRETGRKAAEVKTALAAGGISAEAREAAGLALRQMSLEDLALLAEFDGDEAAVQRITSALRDGYQVQYVAERIRQDRAEQAEHDRLRAELQAAGYLVTDDLPDGAAPLTRLTHDGEFLTAEDHGTCSGRGAYLPPWNPLHIVHYCTSPADHGHQFPELAPSPVQHDDGGTGDQPEPAGQEAGQDPSRRLVIEGNKAWAAAAVVRRRWLAQLLARRAAPREVPRFLASQLLTMPAPLRASLGTAMHGELFTQIAGQDAAGAADAVQACPSARLPLLMLAPVAAAWESEITGSDACRRATWRADKYSPCSRADAGYYLAFLASIGCPLTVIEQCVADGIPYAGDDPAPGLPDAEAADHETQPDNDSSSRTDHTSPSTTDDTTPADTDPQDDPQPADIRPDRDSGPDMADTGDGTTPDTDAPAQHEQAAAGDTPETA